MILADESGDCVKKYYCIYQVEIFHPLIISRKAKNTLKEGVYLYAYY